MTTDLKSKTVEELFDQLFWGVGNEPHKAQKEIARRLEEAQQKIAEAKAEALEEAWDRLSMRLGREEYGHAKAAVALDMEEIGTMAAEYRAKAKGE